MDVFADIFDAIQLKGSFYFRTHFSAPWGTTVPRHRHAARFHYVVSGNAWIKPEGAEPIQLSAGDFAMIPGGASHILADRQTNDAPPLETVLQAAGYQGESLLTLGDGDASAATQLVCGHFSFGDGDHVLLRALPPAIKITAEQARQHSWFSEILSLLVRRVFEDEPGALAVVTRLSEILFIEAIRIAGEATPELRRLLEAFADPRIGRAIDLIHKEPGRPWKVDHLAREVGMSRTRFADRFHELVGVGPVSYLTEWRLQRAAIALRSGHRSVAEIAFASGYSNQAAFTRAFKDRYGAPPNAYRKGSPTR